MAYAARVMRGLIIDDVRRRQSQKRGGLFEITSLGTELSESRRGCPGTGAHRRCARRARQDRSGARGNRRPEILLRLLLRRDRGDAPASPSAPCSATGRRPASTCIARSPTRRRSPSVRRDAAPQPRPLARAGPVSGRSARSADRGRAEWLASIGADDATLAADLRALLAEHESSTPRNSSQQAVPLPKHAGLLDAQRTNHRLVPASSSASVRAAWAACGWASAATAASRDGSRSSCSTSR